MAIFDREHGDEEEVNNSEPDLKIQGELKIAGHCFAVEKAVLCGNLLPGHFFWTLRIHSLGELDGEEVEPFAYSENLLCLRNRQIDRLSDILGRAFSWEESYDKESEKTQAGLYVYSHEEINESTLVFSRDQNGLQVKWEGITEVGSDQFDDMDEITFSVEAPVEFEGFVVHRIPEDQALEELRKWVTGETFKEPVKQQDNSLLFEVADR